MEDILALYQGIKALAKDGIKDAIIIGDSRILVKSLNSNNSLMELNLDHIYER